MKVNAIESNYSSKKQLKKQAVQANMSAPSFEGASKLHKVSGKKLAIALAAGLMIATPAIGQSARDYRYGELTGQAIELRSDIATLKMNNISLNSQINNNDFAIQSKTSSAITYATMYESYQDKAYSASRSYHNSTGSMRTHWRNQVNYYEAKMTELIRIVYALDAEIKRLKNENNMLENKIITNNSIINSKQRELNSVEAEINQLK